MQQTYVDSFSLRALVLAKRDIHKASGPVLFVWPLMWCVCSKIFRKNKKEKIISSVCFSFFCGTDLSWIYWSEGISKNRFRSFRIICKLRMGWITCSSQGKKNATLPDALYSKSVRYRAFCCRWDLQFLRQVVGLNEMKHYNLIMVYFCRRKVVALNRVRCLLISWKSAAKNCSLLVFVQISHSFSRMNVCV